MIVLDTNQLDRHPLDSAFIKFLTILARSTGHQLAISRVTFEERCAHYQNRLHRAYAQQRKSRIELQDLLQASGSEKYKGMRLETPRDDAISRMCSAYKTRLASIFKIIELDGDSAIEALRREAWRVPPAATSFDAKGSGARDAAIWLSLIKVSSESHEVIYFISADKRAFADNRCAVDVSESGARITVFSDISQLFDALADNVDEEISISEVRESSVIKERIYGYLKRRDPGLGLLWEISSIAIESSPGGTEWSYGEGIDAEFVDIEDVRGYLIGGDKLTTSKARWNVRYPVQISKFDPGASLSSENRQIWSVSFQITMSLLFKGRAGRLEDAEVLGAGIPSKISAQLEAFGSVGD